MLRLARFRKQLDKMSGASLLRMLWLCVSFLFVSHLVACCWWAIGRLGIAGVGVDAHSSSWITRSGMRLQRDGGMVREQYLTSLYWALTALLKTPSIGDFIRTHARNHAYLQSSFTSFFSHHIPPSPFPSHSSYYTYTGPDTPLEKTFTFVITIFGVLAFTSSMDGRCVERRHQARRTQARALCGYQSGRDAVDYTADHRGLDKARGDREQGRS